MKNNTINKSKDKKLNSYMERRINMQKILSLIKLIFCSLFIVSVGFGESTTEPTANIAVKIIFTANQDTQDVIKEVQQSNKDFIVEFINKEDINEPPGDFGIKIPYTALANIAGNYEIIANFVKIPYATKNRLRYLGWMCKKTIVQKVNSKIINQKFKSTQSSAPIGLEWKINLDTCKSEGIN